MLLKLHSNRHPMEDGEYRLRIGSHRQCALDGAAHFDSRNHLHRPGDFPRALYALDTSADVFAGWHSISVTGDRTQETCMYRDVSWSLSACHWSLRL
jgi:hypothetical protein